VGTAALFKYPTNVVVSPSSGNIYIVDAYYAKVRVLYPNLTVATLAGGGGGAASTANSRGYVNGVGTSALFRSSSSSGMGLYVDAAENVYVGDSNNHVLRKITPAGTVSTIAGSGVSASADGVGTSASFINLAGVTGDGSGNLFVVDTSAQLIRRVATDMTVSTLAGANSALRYQVNAAGTMATFQSPSAVAVDASFNLYIADTGNHAIRVAFANATVVTLAGGGQGTYGPASGYADGTRTSATFNQPGGVAVHSASGTVYVADTSNGCVLYVNQRSLATARARLARAAPTGCRALCFQRADRQ
jgi:DNA-binding beta-propeller fold protein YncE